MLEIISCVIKISILYVVNLTLLTGQQYYHCPSVLRLLAVTSDFVYLEIYLPWDRNVHQTRSCNQNNRIFGITGVQND